MSLRYFYPNTHIEEHSVDGGVGHYLAVGSGIAWVALEAANGNEADDDGTAYGNICYAYFTSDNVADKWVGIFRGVAVFYVTIPHPVLSATLSLYGALKSDIQGWLPTTNIYSAAPALNTALAAGDFDSLGTTPYCNTPITYPNWNASGYNDFVLNNAGLVALNAAIVSDSIFKVGIRNANYDVAGAPPGVWVANKSSGIGWYQSEKGEAYRPKLAVDENMPSGDETVIGNKVSLEAIRNLEIVYGGRAYVSKSGNFIYESRYHRNV